MTGSQPPALSRLFTVQHYADVVHSAMRQQRQRLARQPPKLGDGYLFAIALADLVKAARVAQEVTSNPDLTRALEEFDKAVPLAKDFRDLLEHWDDYSKGKGRQRVRLGLDPDRHWFWWKSTSPLVLRIGGTKSGRDFVVNEANDAAAALYSAVSRALLAARVSP